LVMGVGSAAPLWIFTVPGLRLLAVAACAATKPARMASARTTRASTLRLLILPLAIGPHPLSLLWLVSRSRAGASDLCGHAERDAVEEDVDDLGPDSTTIGGLHSTGAGWMQRGG
jgi:hypothetical protein